MFYICSLPNVKGSGPINELFADDKRRVRAFIEREDRPGRAVYECAIQLMDGATRRNSDSVASIDRIIIDIDFKDVDATPEQILHGLQTLPLPPCEIRDSGGGGYHAEYILKESVGRGDPQYELAADLIKQLQFILCGDPAPTHPAALFRVVGTMNSKREVPKICKTVWLGPSAAVDLTEIQAMVELVEQPIFERKEKPKGNGHADTSGLDDKPAVDADARLAAIAYKGSGESSIHTTWVECAGSLLAKGVSATDTYLQILQATETSAACQADPARKNWGKNLLAVITWVIEQDRLLVGSLPPKAQLQWNTAKDEGKRPRLVYRADFGLHVRGMSCEKGENETSETKTEEAKPASSPPPPRGGWCYYDSTKPIPPRWAIKNILPERGVGILAGQWGTLKTTTALDTSISVMAGIPFAGQYRVKRRGAVIYFAPEGAGTLQSRLQAIARHRGAPEKLPFAWREDCPVLTERTAAATMLGLVNEAAVHLKLAFQPVRRLRGGH
jgi:hypothetical protein